MGERKKWVELRRSSQCERKKTREALPCKADLEYISSAGLRVLISTQKKLKADNIPMTIKNVNDSVREIFRMSGFDKILKIE